MSQHWIEDLRFSVENFSESGNLLEVLARVHDLDAARAAYEACWAKYPGCFSSLRRSDRDVSEVRTL
jgi:hypothetical protein